MPVPAPCRAPPRRIDGRDGEARLAVLFGHTSASPAIASGNGSKISVKTMRSGGRSRDTRRRNGTRPAGPRPTKRHVPPGRRSISHGGHRVPVIEDAPPAPDVFGLRHRLEHELPRRIEQAGQRISRSDGVVILNVSLFADAAYGHVSSPCCFEFLQIGRRAGRAAAPRYAR